MAEEHDYVPIISRPLQYLLDLQVQINQHITVSKGDPRSHFGANRAWKLNANKNHQADHSEEEKQHVRNIVITISFTGHI